MNVLVIGGSGYLGTAVARLCAARGWRVRTLSRSGAAPEGAEGIRGDIRVRLLGLPARRLAELREEVTHVVLAAGSVSWTSPPSEVLATHSTGVATCLGFLRELPHLEQAVHVSSLMALGRAQGRMTNRELYTGQTFRNWYEYGKYRAERHVRDATDLPVGMVRFGPVLGAPADGRPLDTGNGLPAVFPHLISGYPVHLAGHGEFPCWVTDTTTAAEVLVRALTDPIGQATWSWFDPAMPTLAEVFREVCRPWNVRPRIVEAGAVETLTRWFAGRVGVPRELTEYSRPWFDLDPAVLDDIPRPWPEPEPGYLAATGRAIGAGVPDEKAS